jgi:AraC-like DNA-binding protein
VSATQVNQLSNVPLPVITDSSFNEFAQEFDVVANEQRQYPVFENSHSQTAVIAHSEITLLGSGPRPEVVPVSYDDQKKHAANLSDEQLCDLLEGTFAHTKRVIAYNLPYLAEAQARFMQRGRRISIPGRPSWSEWISTNLGISDRHVRRLLAKYRIATGQQQPVAEPSKPKSQRAKSVLPATFAKKGVKLAKLVMMGDLEAAKQLAAAMLAEEKNVKAVPTTAAPVFQCGGCKDLHSGIAEVLKASPEKTIDEVAYQCGVKPATVRQAAIRYGLPPSLAIQNTQEESHVA